MRMRPRLSSVKTQVQYVLKRLGIYHRLKASRLYDAYWLIADKRLVTAISDEVKFYRRHLKGFRPGSLFFDVGANEGHKTNVFLRMGARVVAVDPDEHNQEVLRKSFLTLRLKRRVVIVGKAVSDADSFATIWIDAPGSGKNTLSHKWVDILRADDQRFGIRHHFTSHREVETVSLETLIGRYGAPFFIKVDVEGHEPSILRGLRRPVPYLSFEVNLPEFRAEGLACIELLSGLDPKGKFNYTADCRGELLLEDWVDQHSFVTAFTSCLLPSIEVFWHSGDATGLYASSVEQPLGP
jgi:FkbM family methyltransferase